MVDSESKQVVVPVTSSADSSSSWATDRAVAMLNLGVTIQEAEKRLVAHGLSHATAASAVEAAVEERVRQKFLPLWRADRRAFANRLVSALIVIAYLLLIWRFGGPWAALHLCRIFVLPLFCIWFPEPFGRCTAIVYWRHVNLPTPAGFVRFGGWLILLLLMIVPVVAAIYAVHERRVGVLP